MLQVLVSQNLVSLLRNAPRWLKITSRENKKVYRRRKKNCTNVKLHGNGVIDPVEHARGISFQKGGLKSFVRAVPHLYVLQKQPKEAVLHQINFQRRG